jgi:hypothetical protein
LNDPNGTVDLLTPDGQRLRSRVVGLAYTESDTRRSAFIAEAKDSQGFVFGRNQVLYLDAFDTVKADMRFTTTISSFEQDVIVRERLPSPAEFGLNPATSKLEVWTQMLEAPAPVLEERSFHRAGDLIDQDQTVNFTTMKIVMGRTFDLSTEQPAESAERNSIPVSKEWFVNQGMSFLIESLPYTEVLDLLQRLSEPAAQKIDRGKLNQRLAARVGSARVMPIALASSPARTQRTRRSMQVAARNSFKKQPGVVLDYLLINSTQTNFTFKGDTTYYGEQRLTEKLYDLIESGPVAYGLNRHLTSGSWLKLSRELTCPSPGHVRKCSIDGISVQRPTSQLIGRSGQHRWTRYTSRT